VSFNHAALQIMLDKGLSLADVVEIAAANEVRRDPTAAARMARMRERKRNGVTRNVTPNNGSNDKDILTSKEELPQEAKASLPQGAKIKRDAVSWPCPAGVNPGHWRDFLAARKRKRCVQSQTALDGVLADIDRIADDEWPPGRLVQHAAAKGWASINDPRKPLNGLGNERTDNNPTGTALSRVIGAIEARH
jgi:hypothetical protein